ncbi:MAG: MFS transporter, partial [Myxococcota bacterium]
ALPLSRLLMGPTWSLLADKFQSPALMIRLGAILAMVGTLMLLVPQGGWWVVLAMFVLAIGRAPAGPVLDGLTLKSLDDKSQYGRIRRWGSLGFMVGAVGVGWLVDNTAVGPLEFAAVATAGFMVVTWMMPTTDALERVPILPALRELSRDPCIPWLMAGAALHFAPHVGNTSFIAVHIDGLGHGAVWTGVAIAGGVTLEILLMGKSQIILDRIGSRRLLLIAVGLSIPRWILMCMVTAPLAIVAVNVLHGITFGLFWIAGVALIGEKAPAKIATSALGVFAAAVGGVGSTLGTVGSSVIEEQWGTIAIYQFATVCALLGLVCFIMAVRKS